MYRRLALMIVLLVLVPCGPSPLAQEPSLDRYGGITSIQGQATGCFHVERLGGRDLLVTPDGHGFFALGVNHIPEDDAGKVQRRWQEWGFNMAGYNPRPGLIERGMPYLLLMGAARIAKHNIDFEFPDVFDPAWKGQLKKRIQAVCEKHGQNRNLIGYLWIDTPTVDIFKTRGLRGTDWVTAIRNRPPDSPGKQHYVRFLIDRYRGEPGKLREYYALQGTAYDELVGQDFSRVLLGHPAIMEDDQAFLARIVNEYYRFMSESFRQCDAHHMILGDILLVGDHPPCVTEAAQRWLDAVAIQPGDSYTPLCPPSDLFPEAEIEQLHRATGKPILIADHQVAFPTAEHPRTIWTQRPTEKEAAAATEQFILAAIDKPYIIGYIRCQYRDAPGGPRGHRRGLLRVDGSPYADLLAAHLRANRQVIETLLENVQ
jgi:hypothetical protein